MVFRIHNKWLTGFNNRERPFLQILSNVKRNAVNSFDKMLNKRDNLKIINLYISK